MDNREALAQSGLVIEPFGPGAVAVSEAPALSARRILPASCATSPTRWPMRRRRAPLERRLDQVLATIACHHSVRVGPQTHGRRDERAPARDGGDAGLGPVQPRPPDLCGAEARGCREAVRQTVGAATAFRHAGEGEHHDRPQAQSRRISFVPARARGALRRRLRSSARAARRARASLSCVRLLRSLGKPSPQKAQHRSLFRLQARRRAALAAHGLASCPVEIGCRPPADARSTCGRSSACCRAAPRRARWRPCARSSSPPSRCVNSSSSPSAIAASTVPAHVRKSFAEIGSCGDLAQIFVHVARRDAAHARRCGRCTGRAAGRAIPGSARTMRAMRRSRIFSFHILPLLPLNSKRSSPGVTVHVPVAQRGQPVAFVGAGVVLVADADERRVEQMHDGGEHLAAAEPWRCACARRSAGAARGSMRAERDHALVLVGVARLAPARVIAILLAPARVAARRLDVARRRRRRSRRLVGGRHGELADAVERRRRPSPACRSRRCSVNRLAVAPAR